MPNKIIFRENLPGLLNQLEGPIGVELGVAKAEYSKKIIQKYNFSQFYMIDWWKKPNHILTYLELLKFKDNRTEIFVLRGAFEDFVDAFVDKFFDFIYIDGVAGSGQMEGQTIRHWLPKVKPYGIFAGHDYCDKYLKTKHYVDLIANENNMHVNIVTEEGRKRNPGWFYTKK